MDDNHFDHHPATTKHEHDIDVDENLLASAYSLLTRCRLASFLRAVLLNVLLYTPSPIVRVLQ